MVKKLLTLAMGLIAASVMMAQSAPKSVTINETDIQFWTGTGSNSTLVAIGWDDEDASYTPTVVVWGVHWNGTITLLNALDTIMAYDSRFSYTFSGSLLNSVSYVDPSAGVSLTPSAGWNCNNYNGAYNSTNLSSSTWLRISESTCSNYNFTGVNNLIYASNPNGGSSTLPDTVDASLPFSDILYWVGSGTDSAEFIVNFAQPDTAFAWGYLFNGSTTAQAMVDAIAAADPRFWTVGTPSNGGDIFFLADNGDTLSLSPIDPNMGYNFWWTNLNGVSAGSGAASTLHNGDVFKYGDINSATGWDMAWDYYMEEAWNTIPTPVSVPATTPDTLVEATIAFSDILYWVGTGSNEAVLAVNWPDTCLAWGYRWNGNATVASMMADIAAADPRFSYDATGMLNDIYFNDGNVSLAGTPGAYWGSTNNGVMDMGMGQLLNNGDLEKWADGTTGVLVDSTWVPDWGGYWNYTYVYPMTVYPVSVPDIAPENATIAAEDIRYWVGEGQNEAIFVVNWVGKAYAWGYRFATESVNLAVVMDDIAAADERFAYAMSDGMLSDITYTDGTENLAGTSWWEHSLNGETSAGMGSYLHDGDFSRWVDPSAGVIVDSVWHEDWQWMEYISVYPTPITPVEPPVVAGPFCGIVGSEGCNAIAADSSVFVAWATACTVELGPQNISVPGSPLVSYHNAQDAVGPCNMTDNLSVVSLGDGGSATLTFAQPIADGPGPDFAVFENSWGDYFLELAFVEVSSDGERFVRFPATSLIQTNTQIVSSVDPTFINNLAGKFRMGYGTPFDLNELRDSTGIDLNNITYVRVVDVVGSIDPQYGTYDAFGHIVNDPWPTDSYSGGFDLDGVGVINVAGGQDIDDVESANVSVWPNPTADMLKVYTGSASEVELYDFSGRLVLTQTGSQTITLDLTALPAGVYMLRVAGSVQKIVKM